MKLDINNHSIFVKQEKFLDIQRSSYFSVSKWRKSSLNEKFTGGVHRYEIQYF